jgi:hypothetical protein
MRLTRESVIQLLVGLGSLVILSGRVAAHEEHTSHDSTPVLPVAVFGVSLVIVGVGCYIYVRDDAEDIYAYAGTFIGMAGMVSALGLYLF